LKSVGAAHPFEGGAPRLFIPVSPAEVENEQGQQEKKDKQLKQFHRHVFREIIVVRHPWSGFDG
jgi:hypothetical protein